MKSILKLMIVTFSLSLFTLLSGYAEASGDNYILVKKGAVPPEIIAVNGKAKLIPASFIKKRLRLQHPNLENIVIGDRQYLFITKKSFMYAVEYTEYFIKLQVPELDTLPELPTAYEETFTMLMSHLANLAVARRYNVKASVLIGLMVANSNKPWGKIPADGKPRSYVVCLIEDRYIVYDIPTRQTISGGDFPNREFMIGVMF